MAMTKEEVEQCCLEAFRKIEQGQTVLLAMVERMSAEDEMRWAPRICCAMVSLTEAFSTLMVRTGANWRAELSTESDYCKRQGRKSRVV